jgi:glycosyltransferase involved in cell wall biosynthesis
MADRQSSQATLHQKRTLLFFYATRAISTEAPASVARSLGQTIEWLNENYPAWQIEAICPPGAQAGHARFHPAELNGLDQAILRLRRAVKWVHRETRWAPKAVKLAVAAGINPDLVICVSPYVILAARRHYPQTKLIYWMRNLPAPSQSRVVFKALRLADAVVVPTQALYQGLWQLYSSEVLPAAVWIIPNRLDQRLFNPAEPGERAQQRARLGLAEEDFAIVHIGGAAVHKGRHIVEQALALRGKLGRRIVLLSAGSQRRQRKILCDNLELLELGMLPPAEMAGLYQAGDLGVVPSLCWESFSLATTEMMSAGLCVLASNTGGIPENLQDQQTGWLIKNPNDVCEWASALEQIISDHELRQRLARNARQYAVGRFGAGSPEIDPRWHQLLRLLTELKEAE